MGMRSISLSVGMAQPWKTLERWIDEAMRDGDKEGKLSSLQLTVRLGMGDKELHVTRFEPSSEFSPHDLAEMFHGKAMAYAQGVDGRQQFCLHAFYAGRSEAQAMHPFKVTPPADPNAGYATEEATPQGMKAQGMRHGEDMHGAAKGFLQVVFNRQNQMDARADERERLMMDTVKLLSSALRDSTRENLDGIEIIKMQRLKEAELDHQKAMQLEEYRRSTTERAKWFAMAPPLANQLLGKQIFPQGTEDTALIEGIAEVLTPDYIKMLEQMVPPEKLAPLVSRLDQINKAKEKLAAEMRALPVGTPEDDVGTSLAVVPNGSAEGTHEPH